MCLLEFEFTKRLQAHSQAIPAYEELSTTIIISGVSYGAFPLNHSNAGPFETCNINHKSMQSMWYDMYKVLNRAITICRQGTCGQNLFNAHLPVPRFGSAKINKNTNTHLLELQRPRIHLANMCIFIILKHVKFDTDQNSYKVLRIFSVWFWNYTINISIVYDKTGIMFTLHESYIKGIGGAVNVLVWFSLSKLVRQLISWSALFRW